MSYPFKEFAKVNEITINEAGKIEKRKNSRSG
jgi:hypothetical protein